MTSYYLGIDGGGSTLRMVLTDSALNVLATLHEPQSANPTSIGDDAARVRLQTAIQQVLQGYDVHQVRACGAGISGTSQRLDWVHSILAEVLPYTRIFATSDVEIALVGAQAQRQGVLALAGTGSVVYGVNAQGQACMVGGWGYLLGDEGSGFWLGRQALSYLTQCADSGQWTTSAQSLLDSLDVADPRQMTRWLYHDFSTQKVARLAPQVLAWAQAGEAWAQALVQQGALALAHQVQQVVQRLALQPVQVALAGGLLEHPTPLRQAFQHAMHQAGYAVLESPAYTPVLGAALFAKLNSI